MRRMQPRWSLVDILERVLDTGIAIEADVRSSLVGLDLVRIEARAVVASIETYVRYSPVLGRIDHVAGPTGGHDAGPGAPYSGRGGPRLTRRHSRVPVWRRSVARLVRCPSGCTFRLQTTGASVTTTAQIVCPYHARTTCSIQPIPVW